MKASLRYKGDKRPSGISASSSIEAYDVIEKQFLDSAQELRDELRFDNFGEIGILSDIVVTTDTISKANMFEKSSNLFRNTSNNSRSNQNPLTNDHTTSQQSNPHSDEEEENYTDKNKKKKKEKTKKNARQSKSSWSLNKRSFADDEENTIESHGKRSSGNTTVVANCLRSSSEDTTQLDDTKSTNDRFSIEDSDGEDKHIFMVRKLVDERDVSRLLSQGYRFAEPVFIAKTMAAKLRIPTDWMRQHFIDMLQMADSICALTQHDWVPSTLEPAPNPTEFKASTQPSVQLGAFVLMDETTELTNMQILVDKMKRFSFPKEPIVLEEPPAANTLSRLDEKESDFITNLQGCSLFDFASLSQTFSLEQTQTDIGLPTYAFILALESAAKKLLETTSYSKALYQKSQLHPVILDLPAFALTTGPCQLIVFKSFVHTKGALAAVNHTFSEPVKCMPLKLYTCLAGYITDEAARIYQFSLKSPGALPTYFAQQQIYRQQASTIEQKRLYASSGEDEIPMGPLFSSVEHHDDLDLPVPAKAAAPVSDPFSLPPPPRAKRQRFKLTHDANGNDTTDYLHVQDHPTKTAALKVIQTPPLTILATADRYWWINTVVEETIHSSTD